MARADPTMTIRAPRERMDRINARAKAAGLTRSQYVLDRADPEGRTPRATDPPSMAAPTVACAHPKDQRRLFGWGTMCGQCGGRVR